MLFDLGRYDNALTDDLATRRRVAELLGAGDHDAARALLVTCLDRYRAANAFFLLLGKPGTYGLPENPRVPQKSIFVDSLLSIGSALLVGVGALVAFRGCGTGKEEYPGVLLGGHHGSGTGLSRRAGRARGPAPAMPLRR
jgi:hypothetical protein